MHPCVPRWKHSPTGLPSTACLSFYCWLSCYGDIHTDSQFTQIHEDKCLQFFRVISINAWVISINACLLMCCYIEDFSFTPRTSVEIGQHFDILRTQLVLMFSTQTLQFIFVYLFAAVIDLYLSTFELLSVFSTNVLNTNTSVYFCVFICCGYWVVLKHFWVIICVSFVTRFRLLPCVLRFVGHTTGSKTYYFKDDLARMEEALVCFTLDTLLRKYVSYIQKLYPVICKHNWLQFVFVVTATALKQSISQFYLHVSSTEASYHASHCTALLIFTITALSPFHLLFPCFFS